MEIIYKSNQETKKEAWVWIDSVLMKREAQVLVFRGESRECFLEASIDNQS